jgi:hypothetical protein
MHTPDVLHQLWRVRLVSGLHASLGRAFYTCPMSERIGPQDAFFAAGSDTERTLRMPHLKVGLFNSQGLNRACPTIADRYLRRRPHVKYTRRFHLRSRFKFGTFG